MSIDITLQKWAIFIMEVYCEIICLLSDQAESLKVKTSNKKVIAKEPLTNLYEMNSNFSVFQLAQRDISMTTRIPAP